MTKLKSILLIILFLAIVSPVVVIAATEAGSDSVSLTNPLGTPGPDIPTLIGQVINAALGVVGSIALVMFIYGGFTWMTAAGNAEQVTKGKNIIVWAAIGLVVIFASYALVRFVIQDAILGVATE